MFSLLHILPNIGNIGNDISHPKSKGHCFSPAVQFPIEKDLYFNKLNEGHGLNW